MSTSINYEHKLVWLNIHCVFKKFNEYRFFYKQMQTESWNGSDKHFHLFNAYMDFLGSIFRNSICMILFLGYMVI